MVATYGGGSIGTCFSSLMKVWSISASLVVVSLGNLSSRTPIEIGVKFCHGCSYSISLIESVVMVKTMVWLGHITVV